VAQRSGAVKDTVDSGTNASFDDAVCASQNPKKKDKLLKVYP